MEKQKKTTPGDLVIDINGKHEFRDIRHVQVNIGLAAVRVDQLDGSDELELDIHNEGRVFKVNTIVGGDITVEELHVGEEEFEIAMVRLFNYLLDDPPRIAQTLP